VADAGWPLQQAIYTLLTNDTDVTPTVYDAVPQEASFPYIVIGDATVADWSTKGNDGTEHDINIHVWSRYDGLKETKQVQSAIHDALHDVSLTVTGFSHVLCRVDFAEAFVDQDLKTRHGVQRVRVLLHD
jgi:hypothetical protein